MQTPPSQEDEFVSPKTESRRKSYPQATAAVTRPRRNVKPVKWNASETDDSELQDGAPPAKMIKTEAVRKKSDTPMSPLSMPVPVAEMIVKKRGRGRKKSSVVTFVLSPHMASEIPRTDPDPVIKRRKHDNTVKKPAVSPEAVEMDTLSEAKRRSNNSSATLDSWLREEPSLEQMINDLRSQASLHEWRLKELYYLENFANLLSFDPVKWKSNNTEPVMKYLLDNQVWRLLEADHPLFSIAPETVPVQELVSRNEAVVTAPIMPRFESLDQFLNSFVFTDHVPLNAAPSFPGVPNLEDPIEPPEEAASRATNEAFIRRRIADLRSEGRLIDPPINLATYRGDIPASLIIQQQATHRHHLLEEMQFMARWMRQNRRTVRQGASKIASLFLQRREWQMKAEERTQQQELRQARHGAKFIAKMIRRAWLQLDLLVRTKYERLFETLRSEHMDRQLDRLVETTERVSMQLSNVLPSMDAVVEEDGNAMEVDDNVAELESEKGTVMSSPTQMEGRSTIGASSDMDDDASFHASHDGSDADDERQFMEMEAAQQKEDEEFDQDDALLKSADLPLHELLLKEYGIVLNGVENEEGNKKLPKRQRRVVQPIESTSPETASPERQPLQRNESPKSKLSKTVSLASQSKDDEELSGGSDYQEQESVDDESTFLAAAADSDNEDNDDALLAAADEPLEVLLAREYGIQLNGNSLQGDVIMQKSEDATSTIEEQEPPTETEASEPELLEDNSTQDPEQEENDKQAAVSTLREALAHIDDGNNVASTANAELIEQPFLLANTLREYQLTGMTWLVSRHDQHLNCILGDQMGLGKTIQTIALLAYLACHRQIWGPHLIIVPTSVILNWQIEFFKWLPGFKVLCYYGSPRERQLKRRGWQQPDAFHVCITSYQMVVQDQHIFKRKSWYYLILDEAHHIKNFKSQKWQTLLNFKAKRRLLLTGTPLQNHLIELWSLMHFLMPSVFSSHEDFMTWFATPVSGMVEGQVSLNKDLINRLHAVLRPFLLRRVKRDVERQMPRKIEHLILCKLSTRQQHLYSEFMDRSSTQQAISSGQYFSIIQVLMALRKVCNHPDLFEERLVESALVLRGSGGLLSCIDFDVPKLVLKEMVLPLLAKSWLFLSMHYGLWGQYFIERETFQFQMSDEDMRAPEPDYRNVLEMFRYQQKQRQLHWKKSRSDYFSYCHSLNALNWRNSLGRTLLLASDLLSKQRRDSPYGSLSLVQRFESMQSLLQRFLVVPLRVNALKGPRLNGFSFAEITCPISSENDPILHFIHQRHLLAFPDRWLVQYDCGKLQALDLLLRHLHPQGHRCLIFTQMSRMLDILERFLCLHGHAYLRLDGATRVEQRQMLIDRFNTDKRIFVFLLSTRSGGVGINLTGADTVIFYDSDWNPAMDAQAQDRCHRIGQTRDVHIYRLISQHTVEENILRKANQKRLLDSIVLAKSAREVEQLSQRIDWKDLFCAGSSLTAVDDTVEEHANDEDDEMEREIAMTSVGALNPDVERALTAVEDASDVQAMMSAKKEIAQQLHSEEGDLSTAIASSTAIPAETSVSVIPDADCIEAWLSPVLVWAFQTIAHEKGWERAYQQALAAK